MLWHTTRAFTPFTHITHTQYMTKVRCSFFFRSQTVVITTLTMMKDKNVNWLLESCEIKRFVFFAAAHPMCGKNHSKTLKYIRHIHTEKKRHKQWNFYYFHSHSARCGVYVIWFACFATMFLLCTAATHSFSSCIYLFSSFKNSQLLFEWNWKWKCSHIVRKMTF